MKNKFQEDYKKVLDTGELDPNSVRGRRAPFPICLHNCKLGNMETPNLILVFSKIGCWSASTNRTENTIAATRPLRIPYALFYRESGSYKCVGQKDVAASSEDTVGILHEVIHMHIRAIPPYNGETGHEVIVYEV